MQIRDKERGKAKRREGKRREEQNSRPTRAQKRKENTRVEEMKGGVKKGEEYVIEQQTERSVAEGRGKARQEGGKNRTNGFFGKVEEYGMNFPVYAPAPGSRPFPFS